MMSRTPACAVRVFPALILAGVAVSCGSETWSRYGDAGGPAEGDDTGTDTETEEDTGSETGVDVHCETALVPTCEKPIGELPLIVAAADLGPGYRFVDVCSSALLAERLTDDGIEIAVFQRLDSACPFLQPLLQAALISQTGRARSIVGPFNTDSQNPLRYLVLICRPDGSCDVHEVHETWNPDRGPLLAFDHVPVLQFGAAAAVRKLDLHYDCDVLAIGNGAAVVWEGESGVLVAPNTGALLNDADTNAVFVGDAGRVVSRMDYPWTPDEIDSGSEADLLAVTVEWDSVRIGGSDGRLSRGTIGELEWQPIDTTAITDVLHAAPGFHAITESGCVFREGAYGDEAICAWGTLPEAGKKVLAWSCWDAYNVSILTSEGLYGPWDCYHIH